MLPCRPPLTPPPVGCRRFTDEQAAARAYDRAVVLLHGTQGLSTRMAPTK
jgi:hypothetical protein